jgi:hypothetical protein
MSAQVCEYILDVFLCVPFKIMRSWRGGEVPEQPSVPPTYPVLVPPSLGDHAVELHLLVFDRGQGLFFPPSRGEFRTMIRLSTHANKELFVHPSNQLRTVRKE